MLKKAENKKKSETEKSENKDFIEKMFQAFIDIYTWVKYDKSIDDIDDFLKKVESYSDDFEEWFGFSDEFMNAFVEVISSSKKNFGIAIERFKMMPFKFAMEDVPEMLAEKMLDKFSKKRDLIDAACKGPTLLKMANKRWPDIKLFAYNEDGISKRLMRILEKEVPSVNIIKELKTDMNVIMNPPYNGNLHLKIVDKVIKACPNSEIVNLSPIRWLQDPLAEYKKNSDFNKFEDIRQYIKDIEVVSSTKACEYFGIAWGDLGIYKINEDGGFDCKSYIKCPQWAVDKIALHKGMKFSDKMLKNPPETGSFIRMPSVYNPSGGNPRHQLMTTDSVKALNVRNEKMNVVYFRFSTDDEAINFFKTFDLKVMRYIKHKISSVHLTPFNLLPYLDDYTHPWTDEMLYQYFDLTQEEINEIESSID